MSAVTDVRPTRRLRSMAMRVTGWLFVVTGVGHVAFVVLGSFATPPPAEQSLRSAMVGTTVPVAGLERSYWDLFQGFSILMAVLLVGFGALLLLVLRRAPEVAVARSLAVVCALVAVSALVLSVLLLPPPPVVTMTLATLATGLALVSPRASR